MPEAALAVPVGAPSAPPRSDLGQRLRDALKAARARAHLDPFSNPILLQSLELTRQLDRGEVSADELADLVDQLCEEAFAHRAQRLARYLQVEAGDTEKGLIAALVHRLAGEPVSVPFETFRGRVERMAFGIVLTAHPTFSIDLPRARLIARLASGTDEDGDALDAPARAHLLASAVGLSKSPPAKLTLDLEHAWSVEALRNAHAALQKIHAVVLGVARARYPDRWTDLVPRLVTFASWVGYDQDGRTDVTWQVSLDKRLAIKEALLALHQDELEKLAGTTSDPLSGEIALLAAEMGYACAAVAELRRHGDLDQEEEQADFARRLVALKSRAPVETSAWRKRLSAAIVAARGDPQVAEGLAVIRASLATHGLGLAHIHVRLNASQLHNAIRKQVGLDTAPDDPGRRRSYFNAINDLLSRAQPASINLGTLAAERTSAKRLFMTIAQIVKHIDAETPVRFLVAETESGFTLLAALYFARLFGVADQIDISPLFETEEALARGEAVIEEALRSAAYRDYLKRRGRLAVQFGFSDSGRYLGQLAATFRIERLRLRLGQLLERHGLTGLELILFNTHGESVGRGGHPSSLADRLRYVAPPVNRAELARRGIVVREEVSFQGGDGFLPFLSAGTALSLLRGVLEFAMAPDQEADADPVYAEADFASEFFATIQQRFAALVDDPDYPALLGVYGTNLLWRTGSRPVRREQEGLARQPELLRPSQMRAIPNNAVIQQLGMFANTLYGVGLATDKDPELFDELRRRSPRFRRALGLVEHGRACSDLDVLRAYLAHFDPAMWLTRSGRTRSPTRAKELRTLSSLCEEMGLHDRLARVVRLLQADYLELAQRVDPSSEVDRESLILLHIVRLALMQRVYLLATHVPEFSPQLGTSSEEILERILHFDVPAAVQVLQRIFARQEPGSTADADLGEPASYRSDATSSYEHEHRTLFEPMLQMYQQCLVITTALTFHIGAVG